MIQSSMAQAATELVGNTVSHGPLGGVMLRGTSACLLRGNVMDCNNGTNLAVFDAAQASVCVRACVGVWVSGCVCE